MKRLFMTIAAMLLVSLCAFAQSGNNEPLKGDVNEDGTVDVADIAAIIAIIKNNAAPQTVYYWYVGQILPSDPEDDEQNTGVNKWTEITSTPTQIAIESARNGGIWYVAIPNEYGFQAYDSDGASPDTAAYNKTQITIGTVIYDLFTSANSMLKVNAIFKR